MELLPRGGRTPRRPTGRRCWRPLHTVDRWAGTRTPQPASSNHSQLQTSVTNGDRDRVRWERLWSSYSVTLDCFEFSFSPSLPTILLFPSFFPSFLISMFIKMIHLVFRELLGFREKQTPLDPQAQDMLRWHSGYFEVKALENSRCEENLSLNSASA